MKYTGRLLCGGNFITYLTHPAKSGKKLSEDVFYCRHCLTEAHWHPVVKLKNGKTILWHEVIDEDTLV